MGAGSQIENRKSKTENRKSYLTGVVVLAVAFALLAPLASARIGYLFEADSPFSGQVPETLERRETEAGLRLVRVHPDQDSGIVSARWWPVFGIAAGDSVYPLLTDSYQGAWPYYVRLLLPEDPPSLTAVRRVAAILGGLTLILVFLFLRRAVDEPAAVASTLFLALHPGFILLFSLGYLYESLQVLFLSGAGWAALRLRAGPEARLALACGLLLGLAGSVKLTVLGAGLAVTLLLAGRPLWTSRRLPLLFAAGLVVPLWPFIWHELHVLVTGTGTGILQSLLLAKSNVADVSRLPLAALSGLAQALAVPSGFSPLFALLLRNHPPQMWLAVLAGLTGLAAVGWALVRTIRGRSTPLVRATLAGLAVAVAAAAVLYSGTADVQLLLPLLPLTSALMVQAGLALGRRAARRWGSRTGLALAMLPFLVLSVQAAACLSLAPTGCGPHSRAAQASLVAQLPPAAPVVTTAYNQAGMASTVGGRPRREIAAARALSVGGSATQFVASARTVFARLLARHPDAVFLFELVPSKLDESREHIAAEPGEDSRSLLLRAFHEATAQAGLDVIQTAAGRDDCGQVVVVGFRIRKTKAFTTEAQRAQRKAVERTSGITTLLTPES